MEGGGEIFYQIAVRSRLGALSTARWVGGVPTQWVGGVPTPPPDRTIPISVLSQAISGRHELVGRPEEVSQARDTTCTGREHVPTLTVVS
jgi:hypothetical protein